jgi:hypothetical protein
MPRKFAVKFQDMPQALPSTTGAYIRYIHAESTVLKCLFRKRIQWLLRSQRLGVALCGPLLFVEASNGRRALAKAGGKNLRP